MMTMTNTELLVLIALGIGGGMTYGRWRADRKRARLAAQKAWDGRKDTKYRQVKIWHPAIGLVSLAALLIAYVLVTGKGGY